MIYCVILPLLETYLHEATLFKIMLHVLRDAAIVGAKQKLYETCKEKFAVIKTCTSYPNVYTRHVEDILDLFTSNEGSPAALPTLATSSFDSMPAKGFEAIAPVLLMLQDEVSALKLEVNESRKPTQND